MAPSLLERASALVPAVVSDVLDQMGHRQQVMAPRIRPLFPAARVVAFARTVRAEPVDGPPADPADNYRNQIAAIESTGPEHALVVSRMDTCIWGELLSRAARRQGTRGIVIDGYTRDCEGVIELGFPTFTAGIHSADALGRIDVVEWGGEIVCGDVVVRDGDLVVAGYDGVVVVPSAIAEDVVRRAEEKLSGEQVVRGKLDEGMSVSEAYARYGIL